MAERVTSPELRFRFVEKDEADCGDGKPFCMEITGSPRQKADQLAEIYYRVRDARVTSGFLEMSFTDGVDTYYHKASFPNVAAPATWYDDLSGASSYRHVRSYVASKLIFDPGDPEPMDGSPYFSDTEEFIGTFRYRYAESEIALLQNGEGLPACTYDFEVYETITNPLGVYSDAPIGAHIAATEDFYTFRTGFSIFMLNVAGGEAVGNGIQWTDRTDPDPYFDPPTSDSHFLFQIGQEVAWIDDDASGNPFSAGNRIFISLFFSAATAGFFPLSLCSDQNVVAGSSSTYVDTGYYFKLALQSGTPRAKIYSTLLGAISSASVIDGADFEITPTLWWPSARGNPAAPVWNTATGEKLA